jgi:mono/diheme cytochrome c family protein
MSLRGVLASALLIAAPMASASNAVYDSVCALCHQVGAAGLKGQFPRLAGRVDVMARDPQAREFLIQTVLFGMSGRIEVDGAKIMGVMPGFTSLSDADIAGVLNYLVGLSGKKAKDVKAITAAEVAAVRAAAQLTPSQVTARRATLSEEGRMP